MTERHGENSMCARLCECLLPWFPDVMSKSAEGIIGTYARVSWCCRSSYRARRGIPMMRSCGNLSSTRDVLILDFTTTRQDDVMRM